MKLLLDQNLSFKLCERLAAGSFATLTQKFVRSYCLKKVLDSESLLRYQSPTLHN